MMNRYRVFFASLLLTFFLLGVIAGISSQGRVAAQAETQARPQALPATSPPSPRAALGFEPGEDRKLADWPQIVDYFKRLDQASKRVSVLEAGLSTERRPFIVAFISSEENIENLARIREAQRKLADPRLIASPEERDRLIRETPAIVAITCSIHSTEIVASQMAMELAYRLASDYSTATMESLRNTVLLLVPSVNPDGIDIVTSWYRKTLGTKFEGTSPPELYHHYTGHDNNRDWFMLTQVETRILSRLFWREWFPEIVYDVHQQGQYGSRMIVPPFFDPANPNIDPIIVRQVGSIGMKMAANLAAAGFKGVATNSTYDMWWHGGLRSAPYYHNAIGILTEAASARIASPIEIKREQLRASTRGLANPLETAINHPIVWEGGAWRPRDIRDMELITCRTALEEASLYRKDLIRNFVSVAERAIEAGKREAPFAYIVPAQQHDLPTAARMINILVQQGVEVHRATSAFNIDGEKYDAGSYVILLAQPYRANVKCLFEPQRYPDRRLYPGGPAEPPYDVTGWTLPMQMGVSYREAASGFAAKLEKIESADFASDTAPSPVNRRRAKSVTLYLSPNTNNAFALVNELFKSPDAVSISRLDQPAEINGNRYPAGSFTVEYETAKKQPKATKSNAGESNEPDDARALAAKYGVSFDAVADAKSKSRLSAATSRLVQPRVALYRSWLPSMDEGWTRWVLEQFGFVYENVTDADVRAGGLKDKFDVVILPDQSAQQIVAGNKADTYPPEYTGGISEKGVANLEEFVTRGGVLICLDSASELAIKRFGLPVKNALSDLRRDQFYAPGSIFRATIDTSHPIAYGMTAEADLYFVSGARRAQSEDPDAAPVSPARAESQSRAESQPRSEAQRRGEAAPIVTAFAFEITDSQKARSVARYVAENPLRSGWLLGPRYIEGKSALVDVKLGEGRVVLFGFRTQHRAQTLGTFKLLFNSILLGGAR